jgi:hypothetical protein
MEEAVLEHQVLHQPRRAEFRYSGWRQGVQRDQDKDPTTDPKECHLPDRIKTHRLGSAEGPASDQLHLVCRGRHLLRQKPSYLQLIVERTYCSSETDAHHLQEGNDATCNGFATIS